MADNKIQIKRSTSNSTVTGLSNGELAFTQAGNTLHIGLPDGSGVLRIGGAQYPGTLTNNHALVANSTGGIDKVIVSNAVIGTITANGSTGGAGYYLTSNGTASYWSEPSAGVAGSNTQVQYNDSGSLSGDADFTWDNVTNTLTATNIAGNGASITSVNAATVGGNTASDLRTYADNAADTAYSNATSYADTVAGTAYSNATSYADGVAATAYSNATSYADGVAATAYSNAISAAATDASNKADQAYSNAVAYAGSAAADAYANAISYADGVADDAYSNATSYADTAAATAYSNATSYADTAAATAYSNATSYADGVAATAYSNAIATADGYADDAYANAVSYADALILDSVTNTSIAYAASANSVKVAYDAAIAANTRAASAQSAAIAAYSNATSYADTVAGTAYSNAVSYADGVAGDAYTNAVSYAGGVAGDAYTNAVSYAETVSDAAYSNAMSDSLSRNGTYTGNNTFQGTTTTFSSNVVVSGLVGSDVIPTANVTYDLGTSDLRWDNVWASNVHATTAEFGGVTITGDLVVTGNVTTTNVSTLTVSDPLIHLASNNTSDALDIGWIGHYDAGSGNVHAGVFRDASTNEFYVFTGYSDAAIDTGGENTINVADPSFTIATLNAFVKAGGLVTNTSVVNITANATVSVALVANTLSLSTALPTTSGGTGLSSIEEDAILVGNSSSGFTQLSLGTSGYVLQSNGSALVYDTLDGGTF